jgi:hypothetical protein
LQAWKYSSSVDSAGAPTAVVTPPGEVPTSPGGAERAGVVSGDPSTCDEGSEEDGAGASSPPLEQPVRATPPVTAAAAKRRGRHLRMRPIYATLAGVMERTVVLGCCRA